MINYSIPTLKNIRQELKLTQQDMAVIAGVSRLTFIKWEKHPEGMPIGIYVKLADKYNRYMTVITNLNNTKSHS